MCEPITSDSAGGKGVAGTAAAHRAAARSESVPQQSEAHAFLGPKYQRIAISQPTYLPWVGFLDQIDSVDCFVLLDTVQFVRQSWQHRNRIKTPSGLQWITVPVAFKGRFGQLIRDVEIRTGDFPSHHIRAIELSYRRAPFFEQYFPRLVSILEKSPAGARLADLNTELTSWAATELGINTPLVRASDLNVTGKRTHMLSAICEQLGASCYVSPLGSAAYLLDEIEILHGAGIEVVFQNYVHPEYNQLFPPFLPYACILDLLFNGGPKAREIMRAGRRTPFTPEQVRRTPSGVEPV